MRVPARLHTLFNKFIHYQSLLSILQVTHSQFHDTTFHLVVVLFVSQLPKYGILYRLTFCSLKHFLHLDVI